MNNALDISPKDPPSLLCRTDAQETDIKFSKMGSTTLKNGDEPLEMLYGSIAPDIWITTNELICRASAEFGRTYEKSLIHSVAYYLQQLKTYANAGRIIFNPVSADKSGRFSRETLFTKKMAPLLRNQLNIDIMEGELTLLAALLAHESIGGTEPDRNLLLIGYVGVASSIAAYINEMLNTTFIKAFDITGGMDTKAITFRLNSIFEKSDHDMLVMSSLRIFPTVRRIIPRVHDNIHYFQAIPFLDTTLVIECARMILTTDDSIEDIVQKLAFECQEYFGVSLPLANGAAERNAHLASTTAEMRDVIITYCVTGTGIARTAREILLKHFSLSSTADVLPLGIMDDIVSIGKRLGNRLKLIIGVMNPNIPGVPFTSIEQLLYSDSPDRLLRTNGIIFPTKPDLDMVEIENMPLNARSDHCKKHLNYFAPSMDAERVDHATRYIIAKLGELYHTKLPPDLAVRSYIHCTTMFERIATTEPVPMPLDGYAAIEHHADIFNALKEILSTAGKELQLSVVDAEVYYLMVTLLALFPS